MDQPEIGNKRSVQTARTFTFDVAGRAAGETIPVVISTDAVVNVVDGPEMLVHTPDAVDLTRAPLPIIATHRSNQVNVGVIDAVQLSSGKLRGEARFGTRQEAKEYEQDVMNGVIRSISVGYLRQQGHIRKDGVLVTTRWMPTHAAMVAEPADTNAGFFRATQETESESPVIRAVGTAAADSATQTKGNIMSTEPGGTAPAPADIQVIDHAAPERLRIKSLQTLARTHKIDDETRDKWIDGGITTEEASQKVLDVIAERAKHGVKDHPANLGLTQAETQKFSIVRAINAVVSKNWAKAGFEAEVSRTIAQRLGRSLSEFSFMVPLEVQQRATPLQVGTAAQGGNLVGTDLLSGSWIELLRNRSVVMRLGARTLSGLVGSIQIPKQLAAGAVAWIGELGTATANEMTVTQLTMSPKTVAGYQAISRQLLLQSTPDIEMLVNADLAAVMALAVDTAALAGTSTDTTQPLGIRYTTGLGTSNPGTGSATTYADILSFQATAAASNALMGGFSYVCHPKIAALYMAKTTNATYGEIPIWTGNMLDGSMAGVRAMSSVQVTSGTMLAGDFSQVIIGEWGSLEIETNPYANFQAGIIGVRAMYSVDVAVRYAPAFSIGTGITG